MSKQTSCINILGMFVYLAPSGGVFLLVRQMLVDELYIHVIRWAQWLRGRASYSRLREPGFESYSAVLRPWASFFTLYCSSSLSCINEYLAIDSGEYVFEQPSPINCSIWLDASQRSRDGAWVNRSVREVKCKALSNGPEDWKLRYIKTCL